MQLLLLVGAFEKSVFRVVKEFIPLVTEFFVRKDFLGDFHIDSGIVPQGVRWHDNLIVTTSFYEQAKKEVLFLNNKLIELPAASLCGFASLHIAEMKKAAQKLQHNSTATACTLVLQY